MSGHSVQLDLPEHLAAEIAAAVARGEYASEREALLDAVEEWRAQRHVEEIGLDELKRLIQEGIDSGPGRHETFEDIRTEARRRFRGG
jgi:antitoxin ParD1/3/4